MAKRQLVYYLVDITLAVTGKELAVLKEELKGRPMFKIKKRATIRPVEKGVENGNV